MKSLGWFVLVISIIAIVSVTLKTCSTATRVVNNGIETAYQEFKPEALLKKYEWFKDAAAQCDAKMAVLGTYESRFKSLKESYGANVSRSSWSREDKEQWNIWESEYLGVKASYNDLAAQYNAAMVKFNYRFCNVGNLPPGATIPLPREYKPYINQ